MPSVSHIIQSVASEASGVSYSVPRVVDQLNRTTFFDVELCSLDYDADIYDSFNFVHKKFMKDDNFLLPDKLVGSKSLVDYLVAQQKINIFHFHGLWRPINSYPTKIKAKQTKSKIVISPRGMLSKYTWSKNKIAKNFFWKIWQEKALHSADCIHVTSESEYEEVRSVNIKAPVAIIPNGIDQATVQRKTFAEREEICLYLGRIEPKKNLDSLIDAWCLLKPASPWRLLIAGPIDSAYGRALQRKVSNIPNVNIQFVGSVFGIEKENLYSSSKLFVLPTINENFGLVVAEALANGTPVVTTTGAPWEVLKNQECGWWIDLDSGSLSDAIGQALSLNEYEFERMSSNAKYLSEKEFSWDQISMKFASTYDWLIKGDVMPDWIVKD